MRHRWEHGLLPSTWAQGFGAGGKRKEEIGEVKLAETDDDTWNIRHKKFSSTCCISVSGCSLCHTDKGFAMKKYIYRMPLPFTIERISTGRLSGAASFREVSISGRAVNTARQTQPSIKALCEISLSPAANYWGSGASLQPAHPRDPHIHTHTHTGLLNTVTASPQNTSDNLLPVLSITHLSKRSACDI